MKLAQSAFGIGSRVVGEAVSLGRRALGSRDEAEDQQPVAEAAAPARKSTRARKPARAAKPEITDTALARKVESELFRPDGAPKDSVDINCVGRVVTLRGEVKTPELINELEARAAAVAEVKRVENLLHLPKTPSPTRTDTPAPQRKPVTTQGKPPREQRRRINSEKPVEGAEPSPNELAKEGGGRRPAPLGSQGPGDDSEQS
jgi:hypothetical protein